MTGTMTTDRAWDILMDIARYAGTPEGCENVADYLGPRLGIPADDHGLSVCILDGAAELMRWRYGSGEVIGDDTARWLISALFFYADSEEGSRHLSQWLAGYRSPLSPERVRDIAAEARWQILLAMAPVDE